MDADLPIGDDTFDPKFEAFRVAGPGEDTVSIRRHFSLEGLRLNDLGREVYRQPPWAIYERGDAWVYLGISPRADAGGHEGSPLHRVVTFNRDHIVRRTPAGFRVYGTWSHGESPLVSAAAAPLRAILFLEKAGENRLTPLNDRREAARRLLACLIKPFVTADWWEKTLDLVEQMAREAPAHALRFDRSGAVVELLRQVCRPGS